MTRSREYDEFDTPPSRLREFGKRLFLRAGIPLLAALIGVVLLWNTFFRYVPPGKILIVVSKTGAELPAGRVLAEKGEKGIRREVLGEGWHFVMPVLNNTEVESQTVIPAGQVGIVTALGGVPPRDGRVLAEEDDEQGIRRKVLLPGAYRLNPYGFKVEKVPAVEVKPGYVGVVRRLLGKDNTSRFADRPQEKGILRDVLQPGLYYFNTREYEVLPREVGIYQTTYYFASDPRSNTAISFPVKDGNTISMDCTIEWEVLPLDMPALVGDFGDLKVVESNVVDQYARKISRDRGFNYGAQDFLDGDKREKFQTDFTEELKTVCKEKNVVVRSAFIRNIIIPEDFLVQKRDRQLAAETKLTNEAKELTAKSDAEVERARRMVVQAVSRVEAETAAKVAQIDRNVENIQTLTEAEIGKLKSQYAAQTAELDAERKRALGEAEAQVTRLKETAKSGLYKLKMEVFQNDGNAYLRYTLAEQLNPKIVLRLFQSGPGTFWTNMDNKNMNLMLPIPNSGPAAKPAAEPSPPQLPAEAAKPMGPAK